MMSQTGLLKNYSPPPVNDCDSQYSIRCFRWAVKSWRAQGREWNPGKQADEEILGKKE